MNGLGDVPAWVWQVLGAACGLGLGLWLGAIRRRRLRLARAVVAEVLPRSSAARIGPSTVMPAAAPASPAAGEAAGSRPMPLGPVATRPAAQAVAVPAAASAPAPAPAAAVPAAPAPTPAVPARPRPAPVAAPAEPAPAVPASPTLQDQNNELSIKLRAANEVHARELLEKSQQFQAERLKFERQLEDMRQAHSDELGRLMALMVQQVDALQQEHGQKVRVLEAELERLRLEVGQGGTISTHRTQEVRGVGMTPGPVGRRGP